MARGKATQSKVDYLISLGFEIKSKTAAQDIKELYSNVKALENAFASIGEKLPKISNVGNFADYFQQATSRLNEMGNTQYATFKSMQGNIVQVQKAMGDLNYVIEKFDDKGLQSSQLFKSKAASDPRNVDFVDLDAQETLDKQTEMYTLKVEALGNDIEKTIMKLGIQKALQNTNTQLANFLKQNFDHIEDYVTKTKVVYNSEGQAIKELVEIATSEYGKLTVGINNIAISANGQEATAGVRFTQSATTDRKKAYDILYSAMKQQSELEQQINRLSIQGQTQVVSVLKEKKAAIDANVNSLQQEYKLLVNSDSKYNRDISGITEEIQQTERLNRANQQATEEKQNQKKVVNELKNDLNSYLKILSETKRIESSGDNTYSARLEYNKEMMEQLAQSINQYIPNVVQLDTNTDELSVNFEELSRVFSNNKTALEQLTQIYKNYNNEIKRQDTEVSHQEDSKKIDETIKKMQELFNVQKSLVSLKAKAAPVEDIEEAESVISKLTQELKKLSSETLANGKAVSQTEEYTEEYTKQLIELEYAQRRATTGAKDQVSVLGKLFGSFGQVTSNVIKYNLAQYGLEEAVQKTVDTIKSLDEQMTNIRLVQNNSEASAKEMLQTYSDMAYELGTTTEAVAEGKFALFKLF